MSPIMETKIEKVAAELGISANHLELFGSDKAKISLAALDPNARKGKLILVSAITPTPAGEGKTTVSIGLAQGLRKAGHRSALALRQPSMGPVFGRKGTATGGGKSTVQPADSINLHFTGDFHAITTAHCLLSAALDNALHFNTTRLDPARVLWKRVIDMNDRALRHIRVGISEKTPEGRESGFDITAASEIMAILCLSENYDQLRERLNRIVVGFTHDMKPVLAEELRVTGAMLAVLREALKPNLVQSVEGVPTFIHGGPFANIAHGCNSVLATRLALTHSDFTVTEAGFAFDLGGEKFINIKCRQSGLSPDVVVLVATVKALKMHGGVDLKELGNENLTALELGLANLDAHIHSVRNFARPVVVAINRFGNDREEELALIKRHCAGKNISCSVADVFGAGGEGAIELAGFVVEASRANLVPIPFTYEKQDIVEIKVEKIAKSMYGASGVDFTETALEKLKLIRENGFAHLPICMAKTPDSLSDNPLLRGRPSGFRILVRDFEIANGAGFLVALTGKLMRMPALPRVPSAEKIQMDSTGTITGW
jgi:formate--tetrahydrofolate ligase